MHWEDQELKLNWLYLEQLLKELSEDQDLRHKSQLRVLWEDQESKLNWRHLVELVKMRAGEEEWRPMLKEFWQNIDHSPLITFTHEYHESNHSSKVVRIGHWSYRRMRNRIKLNILRLKSISIQLDICSFISWKITVIRCTKDCHTLFVMSFFVSLRFNFMWSNQQTYINKYLLRLFS